MTLISGQLSHAVGSVRFGPCLSFQLRSCLKEVVGVPAHVISDVAGSVWDSICKSFYDACMSLLGSFANAFTTFADPDIHSIWNVYAISLSLGMIVCLILVCVQAGAAAWTHSGSPLATAGLGLAKAVIASVLTLEVAQQALKASDDLTGWIISSDHQSVADFSGRLTHLMQDSGVAATLLLVVGLVGIVLTLVLWFELLLRNAAVLVLLATAPIAASGQVGTSTQDWWRKLVRAAVQLIVLKPVIALVFAIGFSATGESTGITGCLTGLLVLVMAVFAWPMIARFFTFTTVAIGGGMGMAGLVGAAAGRASGGRGIDPQAFGGHSENRALAAHQARSAGSGAGGASAAGAGGAAAGGVGAAVGVAMRALQTTLNTVAGRMEATAGHAGIEGANPTAYPAGFPASAAYGNRGGGLRRRSGREGGGDNTGSADDTTTGTDTETSSGDAHGPAAIGGGISRLPEGSTQPHAARSATPRPTPSPSAGSVTAAEPAIRPDQGGERS